MPPFHAMLACFSRRRYGPPYPRLRFIVPSILARFPTARCPSSPGTNAVPAGHVQRRVETRASPDSRSGLVCWPLSVVSCCTREDAALLIRPFSVSRLCEHARSGAVPPSARAARVHFRRRARARTHKYTSRTLLSRSHAPCTGKAIHTTHDSDSRTHARRHAGAQSED